MSKKIGVLNLKDAIDDVLKEYGVEASGFVQEAVEYATEKGAEKLKQGGGYTERTGRYTRDWTSETFKNGRNKVVGLIYNEDEYRLAHLLEFGHVIKGGKGRTQSKGTSKAFEHVAPA